MKLDSHTKILMILELVHFPTKSQSWAITVYVRFLLKKIICDFPVVDYEKYLTKDNNGSDGSCDVHVSIQTFSKIIDVKVP